jgi:hypothetical protein
VDSGSAPDKQIETKIVFQGLDPLAGSGRGDTQLLACRLERAQPNGELEGLKRLEMSNDHSFLIKITFSVVKNI